ncbi:hypothetical protein F183_A19780 [Bryobacterales bacterium F-183]|nr:hypothetical protein F183_A19780 [Bryobacterales bacterium F-183]
MSEERHEVMIVDDNPNNLRLLEDMLLSQGHAVRSFPLGRLALAAAQKSPPDLILLDINMPEMNGYEVCARFRENPATQHVPVIFLSALGDVKDKVRAFQAGGIDYVSKPFQFEEVQARVDTQLRLHRLQEQLRQHNEVLERTVQERTRELELANASLRRLDRAKGDFLHLISHELRTPLNGLLGSFELMLMELPADCARDGELQRMFEHSRTRLLALVDDALLLTEVGVHPGGIGTASECTARVAAAVESAAAALETMRLEQGVALALVVGEDQERWEVSGDPRLLERGVRAMIETAVRLTPRGERVEVLVREREIDVTAHGRSLPPELLGGLFGSTGTGSPVVDDMGLAPTVAERLLRLLGAALQVENRAEGVHLRAVWL